MRRSKIGRLLAALVIVSAVASCSQSAASPSSDGWRTVFEDDFDGSTLNQAKWNTCHWWDDHGCTIASNNEMEWYLPSQVSVGGGRLQLTAERAGTQGSDGRTYPYRSGMVTTGPADVNSDSKFAFTYGRVEARIRVPAGDGLWSALWLLPATRKSRPEIDLLEILGNNPSDMIMHLHPADRQADSPGQSYTLPAGASFADGWHDVRLDWQRGLLTYFVDGKQVWQVTGAQVPDEPMYLIANLAVGGEYPGPPQASTQFPASYGIEYLRVRQPAS